MNGIINLLANVQVVVFIVFIAVAAIGSTFCRKEPKEMNA